MGYEGHLVGLEDRRAREDGTEESMGLLARAHDVVGGDVVSGGGTGTWDINHSITELQAGSYLLMDTAYGQLGLPFEAALSVIGTVVSVNRDGLCGGRRRIEGTGHGPREPHHRRGEGVVLLR